MAARSWAAAFFSGDRILFTTHALRIAQPFQLARVKYLREESFSEASASSIQKSIWEATK
jgi:hypothetical protein